MTDFLKEFFQILLYMALFQTVFFTFIVLSTQTYSFFNPSSFIRFYDSRDFFSLIGYMWVGTALLYIAPSGIDLFNLFLEVLNHWWVTPPPLVGNTPVITEPIGYGTVVPEPTAPPPREGPCYDSAGYPGIAACIVMVAIFIGLGFWAASQDPEWIGRP